MTVRGANNPPNSCHGGRSDLPDRGGKTMPIFAWTKAARFLLGAAGLALLAAAAAAVTLPAGFQETVVFSGLVKPTAIQFASDGRIFVAEKSGVIKVFDSVSD